MRMVHEVVMPCHILGDRALKSLQSDGCNVYMYLDDTLVEIEHVCCMAHARAKLRYRCRFLPWSYKWTLSIGSQIWKWSAFSGSDKNMRNNHNTKEIIIRLRVKLDVLSSKGHFPRGDLMEQALSHLNTFWT